jgi:hypothetical protein
MANRVSNAKCLGKPRLFESGKQPKHCRERDLPNMFALRMFDCTEEMPTDRPTSAQALINVLYTGHRYKQRFFHFF